MPSFLHSSLERAFCFPKKQQEFFQAIHNSKQIQAKGFEKLRIRITRMPAATNGRLLVRRDAGGGVFRVFAVIPAAAFIATRYEPTHETGKLTIKAV